LLLGGAAEAETTLQKPPAPDRRCKTSAGRGLGPQLDDESVGWSMEKIFPPGFAGRFKSASDVVGSCDRLECSA